MNCKVQANYKVRHGLQGVMAHQVIAGGKFLSNEKTIKLSVIKVDK